MRTIIRVTPTGIQTAMAAIWPEPSLDEISLSSLSGIVVLIPETHTYCTIAVKKLVDVSLVLFIDEQLVQLSL